MSALSLPRRIWRERWQRWWALRHPRSDTLQLTHRNVYILPTRPGALFALTLLVLLLASINYQLNLGYLLTFLLAGAAAVSMPLTHGTLRGLHLSLRPGPPCFAGEDAHLEITLQHSQPRARHGIGLRVARPERHRPHWAWTDVPPAGMARVHLGVPAPRRGWLDLPPLRIETRFPLGIFKAWAPWRPAARVLVYPRPDPSATALPPAEAEGEGPSLRADPRGLEPDGVRAYRRGDSPRRVVWKKVAKTDQLVSRESTSHAQHELWLDWQAAGAADTEQRLSRLCAWVLAAEQRGLRYGLRLPGLELPPDRGLAHQRACLQALALWS
ncbi:DUF58 domain-containing protein [Caldimonas manganoxidans]|uniref:DUF58 domain-containing protein n=1 Tax=Caldimonas manganoxidans TaxID=196015 RepID=UPI00036989E3|nr:DUF58 domain-containing protein [Caldimonas manganoxidans]